MSTTTGRPVQAWKNGVYVGPVRNIDFAEGDNIQLEVTQAHNGVKVKIHAAPQNALPSAPPVPNSVASFDELGVPEPLEATDDETMLVRRAGQLQWAPIEPPVETTIHTETTVYEQQFVQAPLPTPTQPDANTEAAIEARAQALLEERLANLSPSRIHAAQLEAAKARAARPKPIVSRPSTGGIRVRFNRHR